MERKKYQVFISSTYTDLIQERSAVTQCLLDNNCIPVGMEQFPASNMSQMEYIKKMLEDCDYYILILAGRYGSEDDDGVGFTEKEYDYAISHGIPVMSFVVKDINALAVSQCEKKKKQQDKLLRFRDKVSNGKLVNFYSNTDELKWNVANSIHNCIQDCPAKGWVRGAESNATEKSKTSTTNQDVNIKGSDSILLTANSFSQFIDSINYRIWVDAITNVDNVCDDEHFGGIFFLYSRIIENLPHDNAEYKDISDSLIITWILGILMTRLEPLLREPHIFQLVYWGFHQSLRNGWHPQNIRSHPIYPTAVVGCNSYTNLFPSSCVQDEKSELVL